jgi:hypothetical protein
VDGSSSCRCGGGGDVHGASGVPHVVHLPYAVWPGHPGV